MKRQQFDNDSTKKTKKSLSLDNLVSMCVVTIKDKPIGLLHLLMNHIIGVVDFPPAQSLMKYIMFKNTFKHIFDQIRMVVDDHGSIKTEHMIFPQSGDFTMSLLGSGILDGRLKSLSVHMTCDTETTELSDYINRNINILQKVLIRQKTVCSRIMLRLMRECNCNFKYRFIKKSMYLMFSIYENKYPPIIKCLDHENSINIWEDALDLAGVLSQNNSRDRRYCSNYVLEPLIRITLFENMQPISGVPVKSIIKDTTMGTSTHNVNFEQLDSEIRALPKELQECIVSFLPFNVRFQIAKYLKMTEVDTEVRHNDDATYTSVVSRWYNVLDCFQHSTKYGNENTVACSIDGSKINLINMPFIWSHILYDCDIVHIEYTQDLPSRCFTHPCAFEYRNMKLRHLSISYDRFTAGLLDSKILDSHLETLVLRLNKGYTIRPIIQFLNRKNSIKRLVLLINNRLCNVIYTILKKSILNFNYQMSSQKTPAVLLFKTDRVSKYDKNILDEILNIRLDGIWCNCKYSTPDDDMWNI